MAAPFPTHFTVIREAAPELFGAFGHEKPHATFPLVSCSRTRCKTVAGFHVRKPACFHKYPTSTPSQFMKFIFAFLGSVLFLVSVPVRADLVLRPNDMIAICGDSITQQKRYSVFMENFFLMCQPSEDLRCAQFGWSGVTAGKFPARLSSLTSRIASNSL